MRFCQAPRRLFPILHQAARNAARSGHPPASAAERASRSRRIFGSFGGALTTIGLEAFGKRGGCCTGKSTLAALERALEGEMRGQLVSINNPNRTKLADIAATSCLSGGRFLIAPRRVSSSVSWRAEPADQKNDATAAQLDPLVSGGASVRNAGSARNSTCISGFADRKRRQSQAQHCTTPVGTDAEDRRLWWVGWRSCFWRTCARAKNGDLTQTKDKRIGMRR